MTDTYRISTDNPSMIVRQNGQPAGLTELLRRANSQPALLLALDTIAGGVISRFPDDAPDIMAVTPEQFRSKMWSWSQEVARAAIAAATVKEDEK